MTSSPRAPRKDAADNRVALLDAARALLSRDPAASLETIAAEAGLSRRAVYGHFPSRDALLEALARNGAERVVASVASVDDTDPLVRLARIAAAAWDDIENVRTLTAVTVRSSRVTVVADALEPLRARLIETIHEGVAAGSVRADIPAPRLARLLIDSVLGVFAESIADELDSDAGRRLVVTTGLSMAGLGWREVADFVAAHPEVVAARPRADALWPELAPDAEAAK